MNLFSEVMYQKASELLNMLNEDRKPAEQYHSIAAYEKDGITVFICGNKKEQSIMCNALDFEGNIPKGFCANWRLHSLVEHDFKKKLK